MNDRETSSAIEWAVAQRPLPGFDVSGDHYLVQDFQDGILVAVMDGVGHGQEAAEAARLATDCLAAAQPARGLTALIRDCHEALRGSRGVALSLAIYRPGPGTIQWSSVGNVDAVIWHHPGYPEARRQEITPRNGVVGYLLPTLRESTIAVAAGDIFCMATDGIASAFMEEAPVFLDPRRLAGHILERYGRTTDDALVLALRFC